MEGAGEGLDLGVVLRVILFCRFGAGTFAPLTDETVGTSEEDADEALAPLLILREAPLRFLLRLPSSPFPSPSSDPDRSKAVRVSAS